MTPDASMPFDEANFTLTLITSRQSILPKRLVEPGPSIEQVKLMFRAAAAAPDHGEIMPWRFVVVPSDKRERLAEVFGQALRERDPEATIKQVEQAREKAYRAPFVALAIAMLGPSEPDIDPLERMISVGAAIQNFLLMAHSLGLGAGLTSGQAMHSAVLARCFGLKEGERAVCCINVGTATKRKPGRLRPDTDAFVSSL
ncbi:MAG: nitroreductase [Comamonadaceae bacterium CG17_big_fil_post_rev_8_21_14_2_50_60_13]|nr:MAG: nitroreductase [Comamonadaceae bacterium CG17_big_fil_post_rev_8_21_14_2_50_60_13]